MLQSEAFDPALQSQWQVEAITDFPAKTLEATKREYRKKYKDHPDLDSIRFRVYRNE